MKLFNQTIKTLLIATAGLALISCNLTPEEERAAIERGLLEESEGAELFSIIKEHYPQDIDSLVAQLQEIPIAQRTEENAGEVSKRWLQEFMTRIGPDAAKAPPEQLIAWSAVEAELYKLLQRGSVEACATMSMGGWTFLEKDKVAARAGIQRRNTAFVKAAAAGRDNPTIYDEPSDADYVVLGDTIAATGVDPQLQNILGSLPDMMALTPDQQCELGAAYYQGISDLPDDIEPRMAAFLFAPE